VPGCRLTGKGDERGGSSGSVVTIRETLA